jgi:hypothetical protein
MSTLYQPDACRFRVSDQPIRFDSARDAIDAISAFEAATLEDFEYEVRAVNDDGQYVAAANALIRIGGKFVRGYLEVRPDAFSVIGYSDEDADPITAKPDFAAYSPTLETAKRDHDAYRLDVPGIRLWVILDNLTGAAAIRQYSAS